MMPCLIFTKEPARDVVRFPYRRKVTTAPKHHKNMIVKDMIKRIDDNSASVYAAKAEVKKSSE